MTMLDNFPPDGVTRKHLKIASNKKMPKTNNNSLLVDWVSRAVISPTVVRDRSLQHFFIEQD